MASTTAPTPVDCLRGEIEHLPVADGSVDVILSNCVINLSPEKQAVFNEAFRVLRDGGRLTIAANSAQVVDSWMPGASRFIASATIEARRGAEKAACCEPGCCG